MSYRTALVTGASSGIGAAIARRLASDGTEVALVARRHRELEPVAAGIRKLGGRARLVPLDVSNPDATVEALKATDDALGGLDLVVANAGIGCNRWAGELHWAHCAPVMNVNVGGAVATLTALLPRMVERKRGHVAGISSLAGHAGLPRHAVYCATKAFLIRFLEGLRVDLHATGVRVTDVQPGFVRTPLNEHSEHPLPFLEEADDAAEIIVDGLRRGLAVVALPWPLRAAVRSGALLPPAIRDAVLRGRRSG